MGLKCIFEGGSSRGLTGGRGESQLHKAHGELSQGQRNDWMGFALKNRSGCSAGNGFADEQGTHRRLWWEMTET